MTCPRCKEPRAPNAFMVTRDGAVLRTAICTHCISAEAKRDHLEYKQRKGPMAAATLVGIFWLLTSLGGANCPSPANAVNTTIITSCYGSSPEHRCYTGVPVFLQASPVMAGDQRAYKPAGCEEYAWQFDDGGTETGATPHHVFASAGEHLVVMRMHVAGAPDVVLPTLVVVTKGR